MAKYRRRKTIRGGACGTLTSTGGYGESVFGATTNQHPAEGHGNMIAMSPPMQNGGSKKKRKGGSTFVDLAVPAVLLYAASATSKNKTHRYRKGRKNRSFKKRR